MIDYSRLVFSIEPMREQHLDQVMAIEVAAFSAPWSASAYDYELHHNAMAHYFVALPHTPQATWPLPKFLTQWLGSNTANGNLPILGYGGFWLMTDEAHISTIASHPAWRKQGVGELLLIAMIEAAIELGAHLVTLEVRVSNYTAQTLYTKYGFKIVGERVNYYSDNGENAWIMTTPPVTTPEYQREFQACKARLQTRLSR